MGIEGDRYWIPFIWKGRNYSVYKMVAQEYYGGFRLLDTRADLLSGWTDGKVFTRYRFYGAVEGNGDQVHLPEIVMPLHTFIKNGGYADMTLTEYINSIME